MKEKNEEKLIDILIDLNISTETIIAVTSGLITEKMRMEMIQGIEQRIEEKGEITEEDLLKMTLILRKRANILLKI